MGGYYYISSCKFLKSEIDLTAQECSPNNIGIPYFIGTNNITNKTKSLLADTPMKSILTFAWINFFYLTK